MTQLATAIGGHTDAVEPTALALGITHDSKRVEPGFMFAALRGATHDGHDYASQAVASGAIGLLVDHGLGLGVPEVVVDDTRASLGPASDLIYGHPSQHTAVIGVTGTNGKTTVTHYIEHMVSAMGRTPGLVGTIGARINGRDVAVGHTTPEAPEFQSLLADMVDEGVDVVAVEVSSHALDLHRVDATRFAVAAFTNLSQDHLDFHGTMEAYLEAKSRLFTDFEVQTAAVNVDDPAGRIIADRFSGDLIRIGQSGDLAISAMRPGSNATDVEFESSWGRFQGSVPVVGSFNVLNAAIATACLLAIGEDFEKVVESLQNLPGVPGRYEDVAQSEDFAVIVDYAHTPQSVESAIEAARDIRGGRVIALVGAGGDRDRDKRPLMGQALAMADVAIVTTDNPRSEDPSLIVSEVVSGLGGHTNTIIEEDRREAIAKAVQLAMPGDVVLILGRGHEPHQEVAGQLHPFDDRVVAREAISARSDSAERGGSA